MAALGCFFFCCFGSAFSYASENGGWGKVVDAVDAMQNVLILWWCDVGVGEEDGWQHEREVVDHRQQRMKR